jgi:hypothetical protein
MIVMRADPPSAQAASKPRSERLCAAILGGPTALEPVGAIGDAWKAKAGCV